MAIVTIGIFPFAGGGCSVMRELSPPSEASLSGDLSSRGGWFDQSTEQTLLEQYRDATQNLTSVEGEATAFITLPEESFRLQLTFFSNKDSSRVAYRSRAGLYTGVVIQKEGALLHLPDYGGTEGIETRLSDELLQILSVSLFRFYQLETPKDSETLETPGEGVMVEGLDAGQTRLDTSGIGRMQVDFSHGIKIRLSEPPFLPAGYEIILEGYMKEKDSESSKVLYLPKKITVQHSAEQFRVSWIHHRLRDNPPE